jgi:protein arginine kinase
MGVPSPTVDDRGTSWLDGSGQDHEIVLSTRVRLARNLQGYTFALRADADDRRSVLDQVRHALGASADLDDGVLWEMSELEAVERRILHERHVVSRELIGPDEGPAPDGTALALGASGPCGVMINEEDHLRIQSLHNGMELEAAWRQVSELDEALGSRLPYAFHHEFGFLTCCPTNVGTGLRASVLVHLPGLVLTKEINKVLQGIAQVGLTYRGLYGEGSEVVGNFFQISNQTTLGKSETDLVDHLHEIGVQVVEYEKRARAVLLRDLRTPRVRTLNEIMIFAQSAHLERRAGRTLDEGDADVYRASFVRERLSSEGEATSSPSEPRPEADNSA